MKSKKSKDYIYQENDNSLIANEPDVSYGRSVNNPQFQLINQIQSGISFNSFAAIAKQSPFSIAEWASFLHITDRTILRYKIDNKSFEGIYAEKILELDAFIAKGLDTFQTKDRFYQWLTSHNMSLGGYKPLELLRTSVGIEMITQELVRIDYGILA